MSSYRPYFESQRERDRDYRERNPGNDRRRYGRRYEGYEDDDERGSYFRGGDPDYEYSSHYEGEFGRTPPFDQFEDRERPRELAPQQSFGRRASRFESRFGSPGRYSPGRYSGRGPKGYQRSDERLKEEVCDRLTIDPDIDASEIGVSIQSGEVTLEGSVRTRQMKRDAEDCVEAIPGVQQVHNRIRVEADAGHPSEQSDEDPATSSISRFWRSAH